MPKDYYETLGVERGASADEIKRAFRKKAHECHPDKGGDEKAFKEVNEAYQVLGDQEKRAAYDRFGHAAFDGAGAQGGFGGFGGFSGFGAQGVNVNFDDLGDLGDVLGSMFGFGGRTRAGRRTGRDVQTSVTVDFTEAYHGAARDLTLRMQIPCEDCSGTGVRAGSKKVSCGTCGGSGQVVRSQRTPFGTFQSSALCAACEGRGWIPERTCESCGGRGAVLKNRTLVVKIPGGIGDGETIRLRGQGQAGPHGAPPGDLFVHVRVKSHPFFERRENDVLSSEFVPVSAFLLGGNADVRTVDGGVELKIPAGTAAGTVFKLRGKGFPYLYGHGCGDHLVTIFPDVPKKLSRTQKRIIESLKEEGM
jgi:molecular chaperone DnaJ